VIPLTRSILSALEVVYDDALIGTIQSDAYFTVLYFTLLYHPPVRTCSIAVDGGRRRATAVDGRNMYFTARYGRSENATLPGK